jgi:nitroreductase
MDTFLTIASRREIRDYRPDPVPDDVVRRLLDAARLAGSARNWQPCRYVVVRERGLLDRLAETVSRPSNLAGAPLAVCVLVQGPGPRLFDAGRAVENLLLAAWNEDLGSCPNTFTDRERANGLLGVGDEQELVTAVSLGYPSRAREPASRTADAWSARANRLPLDELVDWR